MALKNCKTCGKNRNTKFFTPDSRYSDNFRNICTDCDSARRSKKETEKQRKPMLIEWSPRKSDGESIMSSYSAHQTTKDYLLRSKTPSSAYSWEYGLYEEALDKDTHVWSVIGQRKSAVISREREVVAADATEKGEYAASFVKAALQNISREDGDAGFERDLGEFLDAILFGFAVSELIWDDVELQVKMPGDQPSKQEIAFIPTRLLSRAPRRFVFDENDVLKLRVPNTGDTPVLGESDDNPPSIYLPPRKFMLFRPYSRYEDPFGLPAFRVIWWMTWFKREAIKFWVYFTERFGSPTVVGKPSRRLNADERRDLEDALNSIQQNTGIVVPEDVDIIFQEATRYGSVTTYQQLIQYANSEISKAIIGQTMTTEAPNRGARSLGEVHANVAHAFTTADARALEALVNGTIVKWIMEFNLPDHPVPFFKINTDVALDIAAEAAKYESLIRMGFPVDPVEVSKKFGVSMASNTANALKGMILPQEQSESTTQAKGKGSTGVEGKSQVTKQKQGNETKKEKKL